MNFNHKLLIVSCSALAFMLVSTINPFHLFIHVSYVLFGTAIGMLVGRHLTAPKLKKTRVHLHSCPTQNSKRIDGSVCTVIVMRQYCYIVNTPTPHQICFWVREEQQGIWNDAQACCEVLIDGRKVCVRPRS